MRGDRQEAEWLASTVQAIRSLLELPEGWDSYRAARAHEGSVTNALKLIRVLAEHPGIGKPVVTATPNGDVGLCWDVGEWSMDASIDPTGLISYCFLDETNRARDRDTRTRDIGELVELMRG